MASGRRPRGQYLTASLTLTHLVSQGESDSDEDDIEEVEEDEEPFVRYSGPFNQLVDDIHQAVDTWDQWEPTNMTEMMLKGSVDATT